MLHNLVYIELTLRSWTNECHVANEDIPKLRQLIEMMFAKELTNLCHSVVAFVLIKGRTIFLGIHSHATEFVDIEWSAKPSYALLLEYSWTAIFFPYCYIADEKERGEYY